MQPLRLLKSGHLKPGQVQTARSNLLQLAVRARGVNRTTLRRRAERLRFRSNADYIEFVIARALERGRP